MGRFVRGSVGVLAIVMLVTGCKKKAEPSEAGASSKPSKPRPMPVMAPSSSPTSNVVYRDGEGCRMRSAHFRGHEGPAWNTYPADCPASLAKPGESASTAKRPPGKDDWIRLKSRLSYAPYKKSCEFSAERFCSPEGPPAECTPYGKETEVACTYDEANDKMTFESFVYRDGLGACHRVPKGECAISYEGTGDPPSGEVVPCPPDAGAPAK